MSFNILCLSGGGYLGLYTACILAALEREAGRPLASLFDLVAGTSVGGIIALGLANEIPADRIADEFQKNGVKVFSSRRKPRLGIAQWLDLRRSAWGAKYDRATLRELVDKVAGQNTRIGDLKHAVMVPVTNLTKGRPQIFKTPHHPNFVRDRELLVADVAMATSAAPSFFPISQVGDELFADGGIYANAPDAVALHEAEHYFSVAVRDVRMLSIGTTTSQFSFSYRRRQRLGFLQWLNDQTLFNVMLGAQELNTIAMVGQRLGRNYLRIDELRSSEQDRELALDVASPEATKTLRAMAEGSLRRLLIAPLWLEFLAQSEPRGYRQWQPISRR